MRIKDIVVAVSDTGELLAAGIIGSSPEPGHLKDYCFARYVQWFEFPEHAQQLEKVPVCIFTAYRGSGLALINSLTYKRVA